MNLLYMLTLWSYVCIKWVLSNGCFMASAALTDGHYRTYIISSVGHPRLDSIVPLVLCTIVYNI
jgi:hypothetical protein